LLVTQLYVIASVFAAKKIVLSGRLNIYFTIYQFVACDRYLGEIFFPYMGKQIRRQSILQKLATFGFSATFGREEFELIRIYITVSCVPGKDLLHIYKKHAAHRGVVNAVVVIEIECKCATKDELRSVRKTSRRRIPSSMTIPEFSNRIVQPNFERA